MKKCFWVVFLAVLSGSAFAEEPETYAVERYSVIWKSSKFAKKSEGKVRVNDYQSWILGGVFYLDGHDTAVIINDATGTVEEVDPKKKSPSGLTLLRVLRGGDGKAIRIEVKDDERQFWIARTKMKKVTPSQLTKPTVVVEEQKKVVSK